MPVFLLSLLGYGKVVAEGVMGWLSRRSFAELALIALSIVCLVELVALKTEQRHAHKIETQLSKCTAGRAADRTSYVKAQTDAATANKLQVAAKEAQSRKVSDDERQAYLRDLAQLRADDQRLRSKAAQRPSGPTNPPAPPATAAGADGDGLHLSPSEHLQAAEIELRLMHLQNYVEQQLAIDPNK